MERFLLYTRKSGTFLKPQPDDLLVLELPLARGQMPGEWLIEWLQFNDKYAGGAVNPLQARKRYLSNLENSENALEEYWDGLQRELTADVCKHLEWCIRGRQSFTFDSRKAKK